MIGLHMIGYHIRLTNSLLTLTVNVTLKFKALK